MPVSRTEKASESSKSNQFHHCKQLGAVREAIWLCMMVYCLDSSRFPLVYFTLMKSAGLFMPYSICWQEVAVLLMGILWLIFSISQYPNQFHSWLAWSFVVTCCRDTLHVTVPLLSTHTMFTSWKYRILSFSLSETKNELEQLTNDIKGNANAVRAKLKSEFTTNVSKNKRPSVCVQRVPACDTASSKRLRETSPISGVVEYTGDLTCKWTTVESQCVHAGHRWTNKTAIAWLSPATTTRNKD